MKAFTFILLAFLSMGGTYAQKPATITNQAWSNNAWQNYDRDTFNYDGNGFLAVDLHQEWNNSNGWVNSSQTTYINNPNGNINYAVKQIWINNAWLNWQKEVHMYNSTGKIAAITYQNWFNNNWKDSILTTYSYDSTGYTILELLLDNSLVSQVEIFYSNNPDGTISSGGNEYYSLNCDCWGGGSSWYYSYTPTGKIETIYTSYYRGASIDSFNYDSSDYLVSQVHHYYQNFAPFDYQYIYTNNADGSVSWSLFQMWSDTGWQNEEKTIYTYYDSASNSAPEALAAFIYPNPTGGYIWLNMADKLTPVQVTIYDVSGRVLLSQLITEIFGQPIELNNLPNGVYIVRIQQGQQTKVQKIIRQ